MDNEAVSAFKAEVHCTSSCDESAYDTGIYSIIMYASFIIAHWAADDSEDDREEEPEYHKPNFGSLFIVSS